MAELGKHTVQFLSLFSVCIQRFVEFCSVVTLVKLKSVVCSLSQETYLLYDEVKI